MLKLYFVTVPTLVSFYQSQNQLAAEAARQKEALKAEKGIAKMNIAAEERALEKRLKQEQQLETYKEKMAMLREARELSSQEQQFLVEQQVKDTQAKLGREAATERTQIAQEGAMARTQAGIQAQAPLREAQTQLAQAQTAQRKAEAPLRKAKLEAEAELAEEKRRIAASPDLQGIMTEVKQFNEQKNELKSTLGKEGYNKMLEVLQQRSMSLGVDLQNNQDYLEATSEARKESIQKVKDSLKTYGDDISKQAAIGAVNDMLYYYESRVLEGAPQSELDALDRALENAIKEYGLKKD